jgi:hypothetical protein
MAPSLEKTADYPPDPVVSQSQEIVSVTTFPTSAGRHGFGQI